MLECSDDPPRQVVCVDSLQYFKWMKVFLLCRCHSSVYSQFSNIWFFLLILWSSSLVGYFKKRQIKNVKTYFECYFLYSECDLIIQLHIDVCICKLILPVHRCLSWEVSWDLLLTSWVIITQKYCIILIKTYVNLMFNSPYSSWCPSLSFGE